jgi:hypothetical protein
LLYLFNFCITYTPLRLTNSSVKLGTQNCWYYLWVCFKGVEGRTELPPSHPFVEYHPCCTTIHFESQLRWKTRVVLLPSVAPKN